MNSKARSLLLNSKLELDILLKLSTPSRNLSGTKRRFTQIISQAISLCKSKQLHSSQRTKTHFSQLRISKFFVKKKLQLNTTAKVSYFQTFRIQTPAFPLKSKHCYFLVTRAVEDFSLLSLNTTVTFPKECSETRPQK